MRDIQSAAVKEIRDFLSMPAIAENMTDLVRQLLVYSELDTNEQVVADVLADDLISRKHVVICGTAGSGKTELLFRVLEALRSKGVATTDLGEKDTANFASGTIAYVTDLSGMGEESVSRIADAIAGGATIVVLKLCLRCLGENPVDGALFIRREDFLESRLTAPLLPVLLP
jgi:hypothetical protein